MSKTVNLTTSEKTHQKGEARTYNRRNVTMSWYKDNGEVDAIQVYSDIPEGRAIIATMAIETALKALGYTVILGEKP